MVSAEPDRAPVACAFCGGADHARRGAWDAPPPGETDFAIRPYRRTLWQCLSCGHLVNRHGFDLEASLYSGAYAAATYGARMRETFARIMALPPERSDNRQRVARVRRFAEEAGWPSPSCLDVGSGLGVFPAALRAAGWDCVALDPDPDASAMVAELAGVATLTGDFMAVDPGRRFDLVSFNKVLEHVRAPVAMLRRAAGMLSTGGAAYIELPDGEAALGDPQHGAAREEFFVEHFDAYSAASVALLVRHAGFALVELERVREPSGKYTLRAFACPAERRP